MTSRDPAAPLRLGILISGGGTTLQNFIETISAGELHARIAVVVASHSSCAGIDKARAAGLRTVVIARGSYPDGRSFSEAIFTVLRDADVQLATLAGFLALIHIPDDFRHRVMNIHPALIPSFCGRGYFGHKVHEAVLERGVKITGCTVHFADNQYDHGPIILQHPVPVMVDDTPDTLAARVFQAECEAYPQAVRLFAAGKLEVIGNRVRVRNDEVPR